MTKEIRNGDAAKSSSLSRYIHVGIFSAITVILYYFWAVPYRAALNYREQLQLFQTTRTYFEDLIGRPGGLSAYIGEFLTQFFNNFWIGAAVMTGLLLLVMLLCYLTSNRFAPSSPKSTNLVLSLTPLISLLMFLGNPDVTLTFVAALSISLAGAYLFTSIITDHKKVIIKYLLMMGGTTVIYWLTGAATIIFTILIIAYAFRDKRNSIPCKVIFALVSLICLAANVYIWSLFLPYPLSYQLIGIGYTMMPDRLDVWQIIVEALCVIVPVLALLFAKLPQKSPYPH